VIGAARLDMSGLPNLKPGEVSQAT